MRCNIQKIKIKILEVDETTTHILSWFSKEKDNEVNELTLIAYSTRTWSRNGPYVSSKEFAENYPCIFICVYSKSL